MEYKKNGHSAPKHHSLKATPRVKFQQFNMKFFILFALVVMALADDQTSEEHKHRRYGGHGHYGGYGHGVYYRRGRRDVQDDTAVAVDAPVSVLDELSSKEHRHRGYGNVYGGGYGVYNGGYSHYPAKYGGHSGYSSGPYGGNRWRRDVALVAEVPEVPQISVDLTTDELHRHRYGYSSYGYDYPGNGHSNYGYGNGYGYGNRGYYGYNRW